MNTWIYFVLIAQGIWSITSIIDKVVISKSHIRNPLVYILFNGFTSIFLIFLLPFIGFEPLKFADILILLTSGVLFSAAVALYYKAVQHDEISKVSMLNQITPVFVLVLSFLFLGERLSRNSFIGFALLIFAGIIVSYKRVEKSYRLSRAFRYMLMSAIAGSISLVMAKHIFNVTSFWSAFLWLRLSGFAALLVLFAPSVRREFAETLARMPKKIKGLLGFKMLIDFSAFVFSNYAIMSGPVSLVSALSASIQPIIIFIIAIAISVYLPKVIKEETSIMALLTKALALIFIVIGVIFINM